MHILDFPLELIQRILYHMALSRGVTRDLRLRLVCKLFRDSLRSALFEIRLLDDFDPGRGIIATDGPSHEWKTGLYGISTVLRIFGIPISCTEFGTKRIHRSAAWSRYEILQKCTVKKRVQPISMALSTLFAGWHLNELPDAQLTPWDDTDRDPGLNLLSAAAYLGNLPLAKQLLKEGQCPVNNNELFASPMRLAAWSGRSDILQLFQEQLPEYECSSTEAGTKLRAKADSGSITGAAINGDLNMLRLTIYPPSRAKPDNSDFAGFPYGHAVIEDPFDERVYELYKAHGEHKEVMVDNVVRCHCEWGDLDIVKHLVKTYSLGTIDLYGAYNSKSNCLVGAARGWHEDILDYLLESGMHPARFAGDVPPLYAATYAGSMSIVRKLIDHGANPCEGVYENLHNAVRFEHTTLLEFLLERNGYRDEPSALGRALKDAIDLGLESMVEILQRKNRAEDTRLNSRGMMYR
nr:uncharacterized protein CTRU02_08715 [Colletotrichum truncatum]KAF6789468.1 hypothetical protein CTRU02_08715 [Colletotrichum truncatum]